MALLPGIILIHRYYERYSGGNKSRSRTFQLKFRNLYQEHMIFEEVARQGPASSGSPDTQLLLKKFEVEYLENETFFLAEISRFVLGAYDIQKVAQENFRVGFNRELEGLLC